jgi:hypothetical protein
MTHAYAPRRGQLAATWEQYETAVRASSNLKASNYCALADGIGAVATKIRTSARPAGSLAKMLHHLREQGKGDSTTFVAVQSLKLARRAT